MLKELFHETPDYLFQEAQKLGNITAKIFEKINAFGAPDTRSMREIERGGFSNYEEYADAQNRNARNKIEYKLVLRTGAPNFGLANSTEQGNFPDYNSYISAKKEGFAHYADYRLFLASECKNRMEFLELSRRGFQTYPDQAARPVR